MRISQVDLNLFVVFEAIYNKRNLTRAAEMLCVTQPAVSNALSRMRKRFNDPLFVNTPQGMTPTPMAENIIGSVSEALRLLGESITDTAAFDPATATRTYRLSMPDLAEALLLPGLGEILRQQAPAIRIESHFTIRRDMPKELASGEINLAIDAPLVADPQLCQQEIFRDDYAVMLRPGHPLGGESLSMEQYLALGHIHVSSRRKGSGQVDLALSKLGWQRNIQMRVQHYMVAPLIAMTTDLALTAPMTLLRRHAGQICRLPFSMPPVELACYWHKSVDRDPANVWMREKVAACLAAKSPRPPPPT